jgi:hypothetical protein
LGVKFDSAMPETQASHISSENPQYTQISEALKNLKIKFPDIAAKSTAILKKTPAKISQNEEQA